MSCFFACFSIAFLRISNASKTVRLTSGTVGVLSGKKSFSSAPVKVTFNSGSGLFFIMDANFFASTGAGGLGAWAGAGAVGIDTAGAVGAAFPVAPGDAGAWSGLVGVETTCRGGLGTFAALLPVLLFGWLLSSAAPVPERERSAPFA